MALGPPFIVRIEKQPEGSFGETMNVIRFWLDHCKIQPVSFKPVANARRGVGFEIAFNSADEACLFEQTANVGGASISYPGHRLRRAPDGLFAFGGAVREGSGASRVYGLHSGA